MKITKLFFAFLLLAFAGIVIAQDAAPDLGDSLAGLLATFKNGAGPAAIIVAIMQLFKTEFLGNLLGKLHAGIVPMVVLVLGLASGVLMDVGAGKTWPESLLQGLFNGGFALSLYDTVIKHFVKKISG